jgi:ParB family transcriptional regulator, chromosome partitioning protein
MSKETKRRLGKGLSGLMAEPVSVSPTPGATREAMPGKKAGSAVTGSESKHDADNIFRYIATQDITPSRYQPRVEFDDEALEGLAASIRSEGVMQPLLVRGVEQVRGRRDRQAAWELVAGERRWRAALLAGLAEVPCLVTKLGEQQAAEWALVENLQREDLGALELANAFAQLQRTFGLTQDEISERVGMPRASVANYLRVLDLEPSIQGWVQDGSLSFGHAKILLSMGGGEDRVRLARRAVRQGLSIRALEEAASGKGSKDADVSGGLSDSSVSSHSASQTDLERRLGEHLGSRVRVRTSKGGTKGSLEISFYDLDHFDSVLQKIGFHS